MTVRRPDQAGPAQYLALAAVGVVLLLVGGSYVALVGAQWWATGSWEAVGPFAPLFGLATGDWHWTTAATVIVLIELAVVAGIAATVARGVRQSWRGGVSKKSNNDAARRMTTRRDQVALQAAAERTAQRLQIDTAEPGMRMGRSVTTGRRVYAPWEYLHLTIAGPGRHKSVAQVIPAILSAPGACVASSNKNDIVTLTRLARSYKGNTWVFDPQQIAEEPPTWWWNPLRQIRTLSHAEELMSTLVDAGKDAEAKARADGFFDPKGQQLLSWCLLAAAMDGQQLSNVYLWLSDSQNSEPDEILREHGATVAATGIEAMRRLPEKTRESIFATAEIFVRWLTNDEITRWVTCRPEELGTRQEFRPDEFVLSTDTIYLLSRKGVGSAAPLTTALSAAILTTADRTSEKSPGGRLNPPLLAALDEVANTCRWSQLPDLYTHYRSKGIIVMAWLQSWAQGEDTFGEFGMKTLWDAAACKTYGGGSSDTDGLLKKVSDLVGQWDAPQMTRNNDSRSFIGNQSTSETTRREDILSVADLAALPERRMVVMMHGVRPMVVEAEPYWETDQGAIVEESKRLYGVQVAAPPVPGMPPVPMEKQQ
ncbi:type IV secretory pathway TraG/TraD family ATPase VirD4 [Streptomyces olivoverticillatus]|uniref:Type IV secretory pathway TraG/TraD family ATPase VirD4 n=1 Tax=Streptomyces olivoverticillatus TaxID=66427 RepID=A0A7W7LL79_9ACTN|nr:TraM recognition domain-containing protein [Streptomyces olivoverticillatus]MBB4892079.1 type IV secretory pathway TraG/TraD family ATPase VirD4 [Streptomyces olivoverticillatus]